MPIPSSPGARLRGRLTLFVLLLLCACVASAQTSDRLAPLQRELARLTASSSQVVGVGITHLESGQSLHVRGDERFPMASTYKVPIAFHILSLVDAGKLRVSQTVVLKQGDIYPSMGGPMDTHLSPGSAITVRDLLHMMLTVSDNNATDILLRVGGGAQAVTERLRSIGIEDIRVDRPTWAAISNLVGRTDVSESQPIDTADYAALLRAERTPEQERAQEDRFDADPRDTATPRAMAQLLTRLWQGDLLKPESRALLWEIMYDCRTGEQRLKGMLPSGTKVAHKTGTISGSVNDVGVIDLPDGAGHVVVAVYVRQSRLGYAEREAAIAQVARAVHDYFVFVR